MPKNFAGTQNPERKNWRTSFGLKMRKNLFTNHLVCVGGIQLFEMVVLGVISFVLQVAMEAEVPLDREDNRVYQAPRGL